MKLSIGAPLAPRNFISALVHYKMSTAKVRASFNAWVA